MTENRSVQEICAEYLGMSVLEVERASSKAPTSYKRYSVRKRSGHGWRTIYHPARPTKALQHALVETLTHMMQVHDGAVAYRRGLHSPLKTNALIHAPFQFTVRVDLREFFPSILPQDCFPLFAQGCVLGRALRTRERDFIEHAAFVSVGGHLQLPIGAPSSPSLSNAVMYRVDQELSGFAEGKDGVYTRYADDLIFSCNHASECGAFVGFVERVLDETTSPSLAVNESKTRYMSRGTRRPITGVIATPEGGISLGRGRKRLLRSMVHRYVQYSNWERELSKKQREHLAGLLAFALDVEPDFYNRLALQYGARPVNSALHAKRRSR